MNQQAYTGVSVRVQTGVIDARTPAVAQARDREFGQ